VDHPTDVLERISPGACAPRGISTVRWNSPRPWRQWQLKAPCVRGGLRPRIFPVGDVAPRCRSGGGEPLHSGRSEPWRPLRGFGRPHHQRRQLEVARRVWPTLPTPGPTVDLHPQTNPRAGMRSRSRIRRGRKATTDPVWVKDRPAAAVVMRKATAGGGRCATRQSSEHMCCSGAMRPCYSAGGAGSVVGPTSPAGSRSWG